MSKWNKGLTWDDVTPQDLYVNRRQIIAGGMAAAGTALIGTSAFADELEPNSFEDITTYNNYYEFGTGKTDPATYAAALDTDPWELTIDGLVDTPITLTADDIAALETEERIYRFRCVEAWSMVIPWNGIELAKLLEPAGVQESAKFIAFETVVQPDNMIGVQRRVIPFPYVEGLRLDEAMHPLTIMATGIYGQPMPNQNGAPIRLVVPWKYGFKSIKSIVRMTLVDEMPPATWNLLNAREYGFYSNVNPNVNHPRWSQATERMVGGGLFARRQPTLMFNGYEEEVAGLYDGMDLAEFY